MNNAKAEKPESNRPDLAVVLLSDGTQISLSLNENPIIRDLISQNFEKSTFTLLFNTLRRLTSNKVKLAI